MSVIKKSRKRLVPEELNQLAPLISQWDMARRSIATLVEGPTNIGELGETIAFSIFDMEPARRGQPGHDGHFLSGTLAPKTVNVKTYNSFNWTIDFDPLGRHPVDYYLVQKEFANGILSDTHFRWCRRNMDQQEIKRVK